MIKRRILNEHTEKIRNVHIILVRKHKEKTPLGIYRNIKEDTIKMDTEKLGKHRG
jgi:hypothetical protein